MNHQRHYNLLIAKARNRTRPDGYLEKHHVIPRSHGGSNAKHNLVLLTAREHFVAHMLLARIYGGGMWQAAAMMKNARHGVQKRTVNSRLHSIAREEWAKFLRGKPRPVHVAEKVRAAKLGKPLSEETKKKMSLIRKGRPRAGDPTKWKHSEEAKAKMSASNKARINHMTLPKHRERMSGANNPMKKEEARKKISEAKKLYWATKRLERA